VALVEAAHDGVVPAAVDVPRAATVLIQSTMTGTPRRRHFSIVRKSE
jgi:hypothetical protein